METKFCTKCEKCKIISEFNRNKSTNDGLQAYCRSCQRSYSKRWEKTNREYRNEYKIKYNLKEKNKIASYLRTRLNQALSKNTKAESTLKLIGCSIEKLKDWLEFTRKYFVPKNYKGQVDIEHMIEFQHVDLTTKENQYKVMNWKNLRMMTHDENVRKKNKKIKS